MLMVCSSCLTPVMRRVAAVAAVFVVAIVMTTAFYSGHSSMVWSSVAPHRIKSTLYFTHRKLLNHAKVQPERIWGEKCSKSDIVINQGPTAPLPSGIPTYTVEIMNVCANGCNISGIHLSCGWFSSARLINPHVFKRISYDDCLVNNGKPLTNGRTLSFQYANTFHYPLSVSKIIC